MASAGLFLEQLIAAVAYATHYWVSDIWLLVCQRHKQNFQILSDSREIFFATGLYSLWDY